MSATWWDCSVKWPAQAFKVTLNAHTRTHTHTHTHTLWTLDAHHWRLLQYWLAVILKMCKTKQQFWLCGGNTHAYAFVDLEARRCRQWYLYTFLYQGLSVRNMKPRDLLLILCLQQILTNVRRQATRAMLPHQLAGISSAPSSVYASRITLERTALTWGVEKSRTIIVRSSQLSINNAVPISNAISRIVALHSSFNFIILAVSGIAPGKKFYYIFYLTINLCVLLESVER